MNGQGYLKGSIAALAYKWQTGITKQAAQPSAKHMDIHQPASSQDWRIYTPNVHSSSCHSLLALRGTLADVSSFHTFLAGFIHQPPPACVTSALTSHVTSGRTSEGIPVAGQTSDDFQRLRLQLANGGKTHFLDALGLEIMLKTDREWTERAGLSVKAARTSKVHT